MSLRLTAEQAVAFGIKQAGKRRTKLPQPPSPGEEALALAIRAHQLPAPVREYVFNERRKWRFDFAWPDLMLAMEVEGGTRSGKSRHTKHEGFEADQDKYNHATIDGWRVLKVTTQMAINGQAIETLKRAFAELEKCS